MKTHANRPGIRARRSGAAISASALLLASCSPAAEQPSQASDEVTQKAEQDCLLLVWSDQDAPDIEFDRANDNVSGGAISCATGSSASQFRDALASIKSAAESGDRAAMLAEIGIPLLYIDADGNRRELGAADDIDAVFDEIFDADTIAALTRLELTQMAVASEQGGYFELGSIWLAVPEPGARPKIVTVNKQALAEAAAAARDKALDGSN